MSELSQTLEHVCRYLSDDDSFLPGTGTGFSDPEPLPALYEGVPLFDAMLALTRAKWGQSWSALPLKGLSAWNRLLRASRKPGTTDTIKTDRLRQFAEWLCGVSTELREGSTPPAESTATIAVMEWTPPDSPQRWAKLFGFSATTLKRRFDDGTIRHKKLTSKCYQIAVDDLPAIHQSRFRNAQKPPAK